MPDVGLLGPVQRPPLRHWLGKFAVLASTFLAELPLSQERSLRATPSSLDLT